MANKRVSTTAFPSGTRVELFPPGAQRPGEGTNGDEHKTVKKDGTVAFEVKGNDSLIGRTLWLAGDVGGEWVAVQAPVKEGKAEDATHPGAELARVATAQPAAEENVTHGARQSQTRTSQRGRRDPNEKLVYAANMSGAEALRVSASGSFVTIPDGSHADPAAHQPVVPAQTDGLTPEQRDKVEHDEGHPRARSRSAQAESDKPDTGQPTRDERTIDKPTEEPDPGQRTAL